MIRQDGRIVAEHPRRYGRGETIYDSWHYVPVLARKPGALAVRQTVIANLGRADDLACIMQRRDVSASVGGAFW